MPIILTQAALEMVADIRAEFNKILDEVDWMDGRTRSRARAKAEGIVEHIGYPPELLSPSKLTDLYAGLELNATHYLGNALNMTVFGTNYAFSKLRERVNKVTGVLGPGLKKALLRFRLTETLLHVAH